jgi:pimeloyl-ACP methyl ester carboxylesterase
MSYRGYGGNPGQPSEEGLYNDARAAIEFLAAEGIRPENVIYYGESLGSGVAVQLALETTPAAIILEAPYTDITAVGQRRYPFLPVRLLMRDRFDNLSKIAAVRAPVMVIHGEQDRPHRSNSAAPSTPQPPSPRKPGFTPRRPISIYTNLAPRKTCCGSSQPTIRALPFAARTLRSSFRRPDSRPHSVSNTIPCARGSSVE